MVGIDVSGNGNLMTISTSQTGKEAKASVIILRSLKFRFPELIDTVANLDDDENVIMHYETSDISPGLTLVGVVKSIESLRTSELTEKALSEVVNKIIQEMEENPGDIYDIYGMLENGTEFKWPKKLKKVKDKGKWMILFPEETDLEELDVFCERLKKDGFVACNIKGIEIYNLENGNWRRVN